MINARHLTDFQDAFNKLLADSSFATLDEAQKFEAWYEKNRYLTHWDMIRYTQSQILIQADIAIKHLKAYLVDLE